MNKNIILATATMSLLYSCSVYPPVVQTRFNIRAVEYFDSIPEHNVLFEHWETILFVFNDNTCFSFSNYEITGINITFDILDAIFKELNKTIFDVKVVIHNHFLVKSFSYTDLWYLKRLRLRGFTGSFQLYFTPTNKIVETIE